MRISSLDRRVLRRGYTDGVQKLPQPFYKRLGLERSTADYVVEKLEKEKLFTRLSYEINLPAFGIRRFAWVFFSVNHWKFKEENFVNKVIAFPEIGSVLKITGNYDYAVAIIGKSISQINEFIMSFEKIFQDEIENIEIIFANKEHKRHYLKTDDTPTQELNKVDCNILREKLKNPEISLKRLSQKYGIHRNTVSNRWKKIWKNKLLLKKHFELSEAGYREVGRGLKLFMIIKPFPGKEDVLVKRLINIEEVENIFSSLSNEIVINIRVADSPALDNFHNKMLTGLHNIVKSSKTILVIGGRKKPFLTLDNICQINANVCEFCED